MVNYWAIIIGINQYHLFQPLDCAQADAEALKDFLVTAGFKPQNCLLMTDTSPPMRNQATYPTKENILLLLEDLAAKSWHPQDYVWFFFSGYGINYKGNDYLMPVEGDPDLVPETGIEMRSLMQSLQMANLQVLLMLDINRAFGTQADAPVGQETIELAQELQLATILSCQPEQFSHESTELGHGFFTAALLGALHSGQGNSLTNLESYVSLLTPQLCQHHWRPTQNPVTVIPAKQQATLPQTSDRTLAKSEVATVIFPEESFAVALTAPALENNALTTTTESSKTSTWSGSPGAQTAVNPRGEHLKVPQSTAWVEKAKSEVGSKSRSPKTATGNRYIPQRSPQTHNNTRSWQQLLWWVGGSMLIIGLIAVIFLRNQTRFRTQGILKTPPNAGSSETKVIKTSPNTVATNSAAPTPSANPSSPPATVNSQSKKRSQAVLDLAKMSLRQTQASDLSLAIATAKKIKLGEPLYEQAQENIQIWSRMIFNLAEGRAQQRQYQNAVAAAQLVTKEAEVYPQAQAAINQWRLEAKQYLSNRTLLDAANALIKPRQASTYNRAIEVGKKVPPGQPGFDMAQKAINKWSEKILDLAKTRAAQGDLNAAIETAALIPETTTAYEDGQEAIQKWQARRIKN
ncbi:caspase family protein [Fortiea contorta]|uniref:caspase family protein n=1 Tax=Fortiea contorta TaxID=1892405 RepID=UPI00034B5FBF|nr:caspase family protein [Fortiea contorta]